MMSINMDVEPAILEMRDVESAFNALNIEGTRQYYKCHTFPTDLS